MIRHILKKVWILVSTYFMFVVFSFAINSTEKLTQALTDIYNRDQEHRSKKTLCADIIKELKFIDAINLLKIRAVVRKFNWPDTFYIDELGSRTIFLVIQHSNLNIQRNYLPLIQRAVLENKLKPRNEALLEDRIAIQEGRLQIYGSQVGVNKKGKYFVFPIMDVANVDVRREEKGLEPIADYLNLWDIKWNMEEI